MMVTYYELRELQKKERESASITPLPKNFYKEIEHFLNEKQKEVASSGSIIAIQEYENMKKIVRWLQERRQEKILMYASKGIEVVGLTEDEEVLLNGVISVIEERKKKLETLFSELNEQRKDRRRIKLLNNIPQYRGLDNVVYGPFAEGEECELPFTEAEVLVKNKIAVVVEC